MKGNSTGCDITGKGMSNSEILELMIKQMIRETLKEERLSAEKGYLLNVDDEEENIIMEEEIKPVTPAKEIENSTAVGTKSSVKSLKESNSLLEEVLLYVNYQRFFEDSLKVDENQIFATAIKEFVEKPENAKKISIMKNFLKDDENDLEYNRIKNFALRLDELDYHKMTQIAKNKNRSVNFVICEAIKDYIKNISIIN